MNTKIPENINELNRESVLPNLDAEIAARRETVTLLDKTKGIKTSSEVEAEVKVEVVPEILESAKAAAQTAQETGGSFKENDQRAIINKLNRALSGQLDLKVGHEVTKDREINVADLADALMVQTRKRMDESESGQN